MVDITHHTKKALVNIENLIILRYKYCMLISLYVNIMTDLFYVSYATFTLV